MDYATSLRIFSTERSGKEADEHAHAEHSDRNNERGEVQAGILVGYRRCNHQRDEVAQKHCDSLQDEHDVRR